MLDLEDVIYKTFGVSIEGYDSAVMVDADLNIRFISYHREQTTGYGNEVLGKNIMEYINPVDHDYMMDHFDLGIEISAQYQMLHKSNGFIPYRSKIVPLTKKRVIYGYLILTKHRLQLQLIAI